jgi:hypothetical protein
MRGCKMIFMFVATPVESLQFVYMFRLMIIVSGDTD